MINYNTHTHCIKPTAVIQHLRGGSGATWWVDYRVSRICNAQFYQSCSLFGASFSYGTRVCHPYSKV